MYIYDISSLRVKIYLNSVWGMGDTHLAHGKAFVTRVMKLFIIQGKILD